MQAEKRFFASMSVAASLAIPPFCQGATAVEAEEDADLQQSQSAAIQ
jgi:hypothetical protein